MGTEDKKRIHTPDLHPELAEADLEGRETSVAERETAVDERETAVDAREVAQDERMDAAQKIRIAADERDLVSGARDVAADKRENELDRADMLNVQGDYGAHWPERRNAGSDRAHAKDDRNASHADRIALTAKDEDATDGT